MRSIAGRRDFLIASCGVAAGLSLPGLSAAAPPARLTVEPLGDGLVLISGAGGNVVALSGADGLLIVDGGSAERSPELLKLLAGLPAGHHIRTVFNTHWHWDHTGANELLRKAGATIIAHENTRLWLGTPSLGSVAEPHLLPARPKALPTQTFYKSGSSASASQPIEYGYLPQAHTDGDIYVYFREPECAGGGRCGGRRPAIRSSTTAPAAGSCGMVNATKKLLDLSDDQTRIVPGTGPVQTKRGSGGRARHAGDAARESVAADAQGHGGRRHHRRGRDHEFDAKWGNPDLFITNAYRGLYGHVREMRGVSRHRARRSRRETQCILALRCSPASRLLGGRCAARRPAQRSADKHWALARRLLREMPQRDGLGRQASPSTPCSRQAFPRMPRSGKRRSASCAAA